MTQSKNNQTVNGQSPNNITNETIIINPNATNQDETKEIDLDTSKFEKKVVLKQSPVWAKATAWGIMGVTVFAVGWAYFAKIEQVVLAKGQLKPEVAVKEIQAPINGVVKEVNVKDGQKILEGESILVFDSEATEAQLKSLKKIRDTLNQENKFYRTLMNSNLTPAMIQQAMISLKLPVTIQALALNRTSLVQENNIFAIQLGGGVNIAGLKPEEILRINASKAELNSRAQAARLKMEQLEKQYNQNQVLIRDTKSKIENDLQVLEKIAQRNKSSISVAEQALERIAQRNKLSIPPAEQSLQVEKDILISIEPLVEEGGIARIQRDRQRQQVQDREKELIELKANGKIEYNNRQRELDELKANGRIEYDNQKQQLITRVAELEQLKEETERLKLNIDQAREEFNNTIAVSAKDLRERMAQNNQRISEIDTQINKVIIENEKTIAETVSQITTAEQTMKYQELKAPVSGTIFDLQANPGFVPKSGQAEALVKIVPDPGPNNPLIAEVYVTNEDIGFVQKGQITDVRIDSFSYSEFGDIKGEVFFVGSDALPPDEIHKFYRFPIKVQLNQQKLVVRGEPKELQSGMSVSVNIKVRENRTVLSLFTEKFMRKTDSLKQVR